jgi:hypothetical protein
MMCNVGYALNPKKLRKSEVANNGVKSEWAGGGLADILQIQHCESGSECQIVFTAWDPLIPPELQPEFHVIIHKLTEDIEREDSKEKLEALNKYLIHYPNTKIVDPVESVREVTSRIRTIENLRNAQLIACHKSPFTQPLFHFVTKEMTSMEIKLDLKRKQINYPIICKPIEACGTPDSHSMVRVIHFDSFTIFYYLSFLGYHRVSK